MSRYYLISSLPSLSLDRPPQITAEAFLEACRAQLGRGDAEAAEELCSGTVVRSPKSEVLSPNAGVGDLGLRTSDSGDCPPQAQHSSAATRHPFVKAWRQKETLLRNAIVKARARARGADAVQWLCSGAAVLRQGDDTQIERLVEDAFQQPDPLRRERALDKARWAMAAELQGLDPMGINVALAYAVKLSLALRWAKLDAGRGREVFEELTEEVFSC